MSASLRGRVLCLVAAFCAASWFVACCRADDIAYPVAAPPNPEFLNYLRNLASGRQPTCSEDGYPLGLIPSPVDLSHIRSRNVLPAGSTEESMPSSFDLRLQTPAKLPAVRNQGSCGACWAFAAYGSFESCLLPSQSYDFSENHLKNTHGFDWTCCEAGDHFMTTAYLARWGGPVLESSEPYSSNCTSPTGLSPVVHVQSVNFIPNRAGPLDNTNIKQAVMSSGPVYTELYWTDSSYNATTMSYYNKTAMPINHAVCIVGWDDNYASINFATTPPGNGAFICRNSWGSSWGDSGYFYASYYDAVIGTNIAVFNSAEPVNNYERIYQYDPLGWVASTGYESNTAWFGNVFTAVAACQVKAAGFYAASPNSSYELSVYLSPVTGPVSSTGPALTQTGTLPLGGYHTIQLNSTVGVSAGQKFSAVVKLTTPGYNTPIAYEYPMSQYSSQADSNPGESYISLNGVSWSDIHSFYDRANVCLKVFVNDDYLTVSPSTGLDSEGFVRSQFSPSSKVYTLTNVSSSSLGWTASAPADWLTVSPAGGTLNASETTTVAVSINAIAANLPTGYYLGAAQFHAIGGIHGDIIRQVNLAVMSLYDIRPSPFCWVEPASSACLSLGDNAVSAAQNIPFAFSYYEKPYTKLYVAANGMVGFASAGLLTSANVDLPNAATPNAVLCPYWDHLNPGAGGIVKIGTCGTLPDRKLVISWVGVPIKANPTSTLTFQVVLCEGSKDMLFQYLDVAEGDSTYGVGRGATVGVENDKGTLASKYSYNGSALLRNRLSLRFTNRGPELPSVKKQTDGELALLSRQIVTAAFPDTFYIESDDRVGGIAVHKPSHGMAARMRASIYGALTTSDDGERIIEAFYVSQDGEGSLRPMLMTVPALGGSNWGLGPGVLEGQRGVDQGFGLNTIGLLVRLCGKVRSTETGCFYLDDSNTPYVNAFAKVVCPTGVGLPPVGSSVGVMGISSIENSGGIYRRTLLIRSASDITVYSSP